MLEQIKATAYKKVWGEHSLTVGEIVGVIVGVAVYYFKLLGSWSLWAGIGIIVICMALF